MTNAIPFKSRTTTTKSFQVFFLTTTEINLKTSQKQPQGKPSGNKLLGEKNQSICNSNNTISLFKLISATSFLEVSK